MGLLPRLIRLDERRRLYLLAALLALATIGWLFIDRRMRGMESGPGMDPGTLGFYLTAWVAMMAAMMLPSLGPVVALYDRLRTGYRQRGRGAPADATALFVGGYLLTWTAAGLVGYGLLELGRSASIGDLGWSHGGHVVAGAVVLLAAAYQLTPLKDACLRRCRGPLTFFIERWRDGRFGALHMGAWHGGWCTGCCWGLMATLFALGLMSVGWMVFVAALVALEKLWPWEVAASRAVALLLAVLGVLVVAAPGSVP